MTISLAHQHSIESPGSGEHSGCVEQEAGFNFKAFHLCKIAFHMRSVHSEQGFIPFSTPNSLSQSFTELRVEGNSALGIQPPLGGPTSPDGQAGCGTDKFSLALFAPTLPPPPSSSLTQSCYLWALHGFLMIIIIHIARCTQTNLIMLFT